MKKIIFIIMLILCISFVDAYCNETQTINTTVLSIITSGGSNTSSSIANETTTTINITRSCTDEIDKSSSISITLFILAVVFALFLLPFKIDFSKNEFANLILKRCCWLIAIYLMSLNAAMVATIAQNAGLDLTKELFFYMWLFGWGGYAFMFFLGFKTLLDTFELWKMKKYKRRMGHE